MIRRIQCGMIFLGIWVGMTQSAEVAPGQFDSLIKNSPFGQGASAGPQTGNQATPLEFRGVFVDHGVYYFSLHENATRTSQWVGLKESGQPWVVESYDQAKGMIQVQYRNQTLTLALKQAQVLVQAAPAVQPQQPMPVPAASINPGSTDEATRLALVAEEIRRRRALRSRGPEPTQNPAGPAPANTVPVPAKP